MQIISLVVIAVLTLCETGIAESKLCCIDIVYRIVLIEEDSFKVFSSLERMVTFMMNLYVFREHQNLTSGAAWYLDN